MTEKLRNTEDKLDAAEKVKFILQEEIKSYEEINGKISKDLEVSRLTFSWKSDSSTVVIMLEMYLYACVIFRN